MNRILPLPLLLLAFAAGCGQGTPVPTILPASVPTGGPTPTQPATSPAEKTISATQLAKDYAAGAAIFDPAYKDKTILIEGIVGTPDVIDETGEHFLQLSGAQQPGEPPGAVVMCQFPDGAYEKASRLPSGSTVKVRGKCLAFREMAAEVHLANCDLVEVQEAPPEPPLDAEAVAVNEEQLAKDAESDPEAAVKKYGGKTLLVEGTVLPAFSNELFLKGNFDSTTQKGVQIMTRMVPSAQEKAAGLTVGQTIKVKGRCTGIGQTVILSGCELAEVGPDPAIAVSAADLAKAYAQDDAAADKKYQGKQVLVEGVVVEVRKLVAGPSSLPLVVLEGADEKAAVPFRVVIQFPTVDVKQPAWALKPGLTVKIKGACAGKKDGGVAVWSAKVVK